MARAVWSGAITFGLVNIPIKVYGATEEKDLRFTTLHATCKTPLKRPYMCPTCNVPVESKEMVKGYEYGKGNYVLLSEEEMDAVEVETSKAAPVLFYENEVKGPPEIPMTRPVVIADEELELATKLISELTMEFGPAKYKDRYREALLNMIEAKVAGKEVEVPPKVEVAPTQDLMAAPRG